MGLQTHDWGILIDYYAQHDSYISWHIASARRYSTSSGAAVGWKWSDIDMGENKRC